MDDFVPVKKAGTEPIFKGVVEKELPESPNSPETFVPVAKVSKDQKIPPTIGERIIKGALRPTLEAGGMAIGGILGAGAGIPTGPGAIASSMAGGTLGYGIGRHTADILEENLGMKKPVELGPRLAETGRNLIEGAELEMGGKFIGKGASLLGKGAKQAIGRLSGTGTAAVESAIEGTPAFKDALRGKIAPQDIVNHAREALGILKENRGSAYRNVLSQISQNQTPVDMTPIRKGLDNLKKQYNVTVDPGTGKIDISRIKMGKTGRNDIAELIKDVESWGSKTGDDTVLGLDTLKSQIDDFYSDSSQARAFVSSLRNIVDKTIKGAEPRYEAMTKGYSEATKLIKDIESNLMLRKEGMSGRIVADQTLRRLTSAMKDNFELRRDLVEALGNKAAMDLKSEIAGHAMSSFMPSGISGTGLALTNALIASMVTPKFWPILAASSPRISAEFLSVFGKGLQQSKGMSEAMSRWMAYESSKIETEKPQTVKGVLIP